MPIIDAAIGAAGSILGGYLTGQGNQPKESKRQKQSRKIIDELIASMKGEGEYSHLFNADEAAFQKSFVDPAKSMFRNQIAPQIQQQYIASGQQRGTGLDDQLLRAGVDLDQLLNQEYLNFQEKGKDRALNVLNSATGGVSPAPAQSSSGDIFSSAVGGYLGSDSFQNTLSDFTKQKPQQAYNQQPSSNRAPKGFAQDWSDWKLGDPRWGQ